MIYFVPGMEIEEGMRYTEGYGGISRSGPGRRRA